MSFYRNQVLLVSDHHKQYARGNLTGASSNESGSLRPQWKKMSTAAKGSRCHGGETSSERNLKASPFFERTKDSQIVLFVKWRVKTEEDNGSGNIWIRKNMDKEADICKTSKTYIYEISPFLSIYTKHFLLFSDFHSRSLLWEIPLRKSI